MMQKKLVLVAVVTFGMMHAAASYADTISYADAMTALAKECGADIKKHCQGVNLGGERIQARLEEKAAEVGSPMARNCHAAGGVTVSADQ
ncbi:hypothetical protein ASC90_26215 [Rhizobium sp. Root1220]|nr:hypothetical protein ASC90_26215 [Rhizobium sp. Root1220]